MSTIVCKFGGSSVCDAGMFARVRRILMSDADRKYIVLSAPGKRFPGDEKITDLFYRAHEAARAADQSILPQIFARYAEIRDALAADFKLEAEFARLFTQLESSADFAASRGEYLCAKLFAAYARLPFVDAAELLLFDESGALNEAATESAIREKLLPLERAVIPGFYGSMPDGSIRCLARGGSDVSGALIARALNADLYENWTDVDGLYTADPHIVPQARRSGEVSLKQMEEIARAGAQLLHPDALRPLRGTGIDTLLKNSYAPGAPGTRISQGCARSVKCVTGKRRLYMLGDPQSCENQSVLLYALPIHGSLPVAAVHAFGLSNAQLEETERLIKPIQIVRMPTYVQLIVPISEYERTIRLVHAILVEQGGAEN